MDNSPITGSVTTVVAEKEKLAKASLAFNCKRVKHVKNQQKKSFLTWLLLFLASIIGVVMALPLLQL
ncbi:hypothetical protein R3W88_033726 [Solanum pinnatisectum]|uniref:Uncharacterized protein n=1 Tax=Solanum pinnatisectum TaxID=50273 RepID=A0AAV9K1Z6_9SOLN|nr:hypothetical protein R3W88_033726 [Solanum pinnatisectum]